MRKTKELVSGNSKWEQTNTFWVPSESMCGVTALAQNLSATVFLALVTFLNTALHEVKAIAAIMLIVRDGQTLWLI